MSKFNVKITGIDRVQKALQQIDNYSKPNYIKTFLERLAEVGVDVADLTFFNYEYYERASDIPRTNIKWVSSNVIAIESSSEAITFIEFGAGVTYNGNRDYLQANELGYEIGRYGKGLGSDPNWVFVSDDELDTESPSVKMIAENKKTGKKVYRTIGNPPAKGLYYASKEMQNKIMEVALEVFMK